jgi:glycosylphosphatidylinositol transamidase (GPIT) subunit GPI8
MEYDKAKLNYRSLYPWNQNNCPFTPDDQQHLRETFKGTVFRFADDAVIVYKDQVDMVHLVTYLGYMLTVKLLDYRGPRNRISINKT